jgi:WD40 repeat protein
MNMISFSPTGFHLASGSDDHTVRLWDAISSTSIAKVEGHFNLVNTGAFLSDGLHRASGSNDHTVQLQNAIFGPSITKLGGHSDPVTTVAFSPDGLHLASGSLDCTVQLWDVISGASIATLEGHSHGVTTVKYSLDGCTLISCAPTETLVWDLTSQPPSCQASGSPFAAPEPLVTLGPLIRTWSDHDRWIKVE